MRELDYQKLLIDVIKKHQGFAFKSSNRFLVGVADVFFTIPVNGGRGAGDRIQSHASGFIESGFLECKLDPIPVRKSFVTLDTTVKQRQFLKNVREGSARAGVMSFIRSAKTLGVHIGTPEQQIVPLADYKMDSHQKREALVWRTLEEWLNGGD